MNSTTRTFFSPIALGLMSLALITANASALTVTIDGYYQAIVHDENLGSYLEGLTSASVPGFSASFNPSFATGPNGATFTTGTTNVSASGNGSAFVLIYGFFSVDEDTTYSWTGNLSGMAGEGLTLPYLDISLQDSGGVGDMLRTTQYNYEYPGFYSFDLNGPTTAQVTLLTGSLSGNLEAGHQYFFTAALQARGFDATNDGTGNLTLQIGSGASIPDSGSTVALLGMALGGVAAVRRKLQ